jgi:hypothetical protein
LVEQTNIKNEIVCPKCKHNNISKELDEVYICKDCAYQFNVHQQESFSLKYVAFALIFILSILAYLKWSIKPFDREKEMQTLYEQLHKSKEPENITQAKNIKKSKLISISETEIWKFSQLENEAENTYFIDILDSKDKNVLQTIRLNINENKNQNDEIETHTSKHKITLLQNNYFVILDKKSKKEEIDVANICNRKQELKQGISKANFVSYLNAIKMQNYDGQVYYYLIEKDKILSALELEQLQKNEQLNSNWKFEKTYILSSQILYQILKKQQEYAMPISAQDVTEILNGSNWLKNVYQITEIKKINLTINFENKSILKYNENEILFFDENKHEVTYYNINQNKSWSRIITIGNNSKIDAEIEDNILIFNDQNAYCFLKNSGELLWKY